MSKTNVLVYAEIVNAEIDGEGFGHIQIKKHKQSSMEKTILDLREFKGKDVVIIVSGGK